MKETDPAFVLALAIVVVGVVAGIVITSTWAYRSDGLCDACGSPYTRYYVKVYEIGVAKPRVTNEFCSDHGFLWGLFHPWVPADIPLMLHLAVLFVLFFIVYGFSLIGFSTRDRVLRSKRPNASKTAAGLVFALGLILLIGGIVAAFMFPEPPVIWESKSEVAASEEIIHTPAGWKQETEPLVDNLSICSKYEFRQESIENTLHVWDYETYDYCFYFFSSITDVDDFRIFGNATEESYPQTRFNFYVFDSQNFDLWKAGGEYVAYYEAKDRATVEFYLTITDPLPRQETYELFYFVVEECVVGTKPIVGVLASVAWIEENLRFEYVDDISYSFLYSGEYTNVSIEGTATEIEGRRFDFYIMDSTNFIHLINNEPYTALYESKNSPTVEFSLDLASAEAGSMIEFVIDNQSREEEVVRFSATIKRLQKISEGFGSYEHQHPWDYFFRIRETDQTKDFVLKGSAAETSGREFDFYISNDPYYGYWSDDEPSEPCFHQKNVTSLNFSIPLSKEEVLSKLYFVTENHLVDTNETVNLSAKIEWKEATTGFGGWVLAALVSCTGGMITLSAGPATALMFPGPARSRVFDQNKGSVLWVA